MYENSRKYDLYQPDAAVFEALCYLCKKTGECKISYEKLGEFARVHKSTCFDVVNRLIKQGLVSESRTGAFGVRTEISECRTISKEERTKEENININKSLPAIKKEPSDGWLAGFNLFWEKFNPSGEFNRRKNACKKIWETLPEDWRKLATDRAGAHSSERNPLFYLRDEDFLKVGCAGSAKEEKAAPTWLTGEQQDECLRDGIAVVVCRNPQTGRFGAVTKEDAERFSLTIEREM